RFRDGDTPATKIGGPFPKAGVGSAKVPSPLLSTTLKLATLAVAMSGRVVVEVGGDEGLGAIAGGGSGVRLFLFFGPSVEFVLQLLDLAGLCLHRPSQSGDLGLERH